MFIKNDWYMAGWAAELTDRPISRKIANEPIVLFRDTAGKVAALQDRCCHRGAPLSLGKVVDTGIECGYHGMVFAGDGRCVHIPGQDKIPSKAGVRSFAVEERDSMIWLWLGAAEEADRSLIVDYPFHGDSKNWPHKEGLIPVNCAYELMMDNITDLTHLGYVHNKTIGGNPKAHVSAVMKTERTPRGVKWNRWMLGSEPPPTYRKAVDFKGPIDRYVEEELIVPCTIIQLTGGVDVSQDAYNGGSREGGFAMRVLHLIVPETETTCHYFFSVANGFGQHDPANTDLVFNEVVPTLYEDKAIVERQHANITEYPNPPLIDIRSDEARIIYRRVLAARLAAERESAAALVG